MNHPIENDMVDGPGGCHLRSPCSIAFSMISGVRTAPGPDRGDSPLFHEEELVRRQEARLRSWTEKATAFPERARSRKIFKVSICGLCRDRRGSREE